MLGSFVIAALSAAFGTAAQAESIHGPILGFMRDSSGAVIWPIIGVPGATALAGRLQFETDIRGAVISPGQDYAIALRSDDGSVVVVSLRADPPTLSPVSGTHPSPGMVAISPTGSAAAVYDPETQIVQVIGHLPQAPELIHEFHVSDIPGRATEMALSDDGSIAVVKFAGGNTAGGTELWVVDSSSSWRVGSEGPATAAFFPNSHDAVVADEATQSVFLMMNVDQGATRIPLLSAADGLDAFSSVSVSGDGREVFIADNGSGTVAIVNMETRRPTLASCQCHPTGFYRLRRNSIFQLTEPSEDPVTVLDTSSGEPRIFIIPPESSEHTTPQ